MQAIALHVVNEHEPLLNPPQFATAPLGQVIPAVQLVLVPGLMPPHPAL